MPKLDHIGIAVNSIEEASRLYTGPLGLTLDHVETVREEDVRVGFLPLGGSELELLEPIGGEGPLAKFLDKRGEGLHHICIDVEDLSSTMERLREQGARLLNQEPLRGARDRLVAFVHPLSANGVLLELSQKSRP